MRLKEQFIAQMRTKEFLSFALGLIIFFIAIVLDKNSPYKLYAYIFSYVLIGGQILFDALMRLLRAEVFDENLLMSIATIGAFSIGEYPEGVSVMLFFRIGDFFESIALKRSQKSIESLMEINPDFATLEDGNKIVDPNTVEIGTNIIVRPGERIPLDGIIIKGSSTIDARALTGESMPLEVEINSLVYSGSINKTALIIVKTTKIFSQSTAQKILDLVQNASQKKAKTEQFISKFAKYYTPMIVLSAVILAVVPPLIISDAVFSDWFKRSLIFLVVSCPCALVLSIPLSFFGGIGASSKHGILVKGGNFLEALNKSDSIIMDKTGTLTKGIFSLTYLHACNGFTIDEVLYFANAAELHSNHPIAMSIKRAFNDKFKDEFKGVIHEHKDLSGYGIEALIDDKIVLVGNMKLMNERKININIDEIITTDTLVFIALDDILAGYLIVADEIKEDAKTTLEGLIKLGFKNIIMLTGDNQKNANKVANELNIKRFKSNLLPHQKVEEIELFMRDKEGEFKTIFVGDGINDAPSLARSDVGIAMGGIGSDAAIEAADIVIMNDEISKLITAIKIARKTHKIVWQNIIIALGTKGVILVLGVLGMASMWAAVFGDVGVAIIAILNASRILGEK